MTTKTTSREMTFERVVDELRDVGRQAGDQMSDLFKDERIRKHLEEVGHAIEDLWTDIVEHLRTAVGTKPLEEMTLQELHELATERQIPGRSRMHKAELIEALRKD